MATHRAVRTQASTSSSSAITSNRFGGTSSRPFHRCRRISSPARAKNTSRRFGASRTGTWTALSRCEARSRRAAALGVRPRREKKTALSRCEARSRRATAPGVGPRREKKTALSRCEARSRRATAPGVGPRREKKTALSRCEARSRRTTAPGVGPRREKKKDDRREAAEARRGNGGRRGAVRRRGARVRKTIHLARPRPVRRQPDEDGRRARHPSQHAHAEDGRIQNQAKGGIGGKGPSFPPWPMAIARD